MCQNSYENFRKQLAKFDRNFPEFFLFFGNIAKKFLSYFEQFLNFAAFCEIISKFSEYFLNRLMTKYIIEIFSTIPQNFSTIPQNLKRT